MIAEQGWQAGQMPKGSQLQGAGQHQLVAAISQMGGRQATAAKTGLDAQPQETRGRSKKVHTVGLHVVLQQSCRGEQELSELRLRPLWPSRA